ncbi:hypothetical protein BJ138DRAFT_871302 [Hygrophoropsis aurantiaca]|uniref:Uncharacterized protein n=1 Tax=Hygrophoropsis aurantiaca TaxID=72124 RepID=A0ACB7ZU77_9AGAM|nr:hypothetical protein BJ138DRAFT_871302 [Hygrophoropsis aurantiaca]
MSVTLRAPDRSNAARKVLNCHDIISLIMRHLPLHDILDNASNVNNVFRVEAKHTAVSRFFSITCPYVGNHVHSLKDLLRENRSIIVGSCALKMMLPEQSWTPKNLNIIVPRNSINIFFMFFNSRGYSPTQKPVSPHLRSYASRLFTCEHQDRPPVTLMESIDDSVLTPFLAASCTAEFTCMTGGGLACMYPTQTFARLALHSPRNGNMQSVCTSLVERGFIVKSTSDHLPHDICPLTWRRVHGLRGIWVKNWSNVDSAVDVFIGEHHRWRLGIHCTNPTCTARNPF